LLLARREVGGLQAAPQLARDHELPGKDGPDGRRKRESDVALPDEPIQAFVDRSPQLAPPGVIGADDDPRVRERLSSQ